LARKKDRSPAAIEKREEVRRRIRAAIAARPGLTERQASHGAGLGWNTINQFMRVSDAELDAKSTVAVARYFHWPEIELMVLMGHWPDDGRVLIHRFENPLEELAVFLEREGFPPAAREIIMATARAMPPARADATLDGTATSLPLPPPASDATA
jgi:hypothetical protein